MKWTLLFTRMAMLAVFVILTGCADLLFPKQDIEFDDSDDSSIVDSGETGDTGSHTGDTDTSEPTDADGDGFDSTVDCDDQNPAVNPAATETCDNLDNDCDNLVDDEDDSVEAGTTWYVDGDGDGYGDASSTMQACTEPPGYVSSSTDCRDSDAAYHPNADESDCSGSEDYNCDGSVGSDDRDGDGWLACEECDDSASSVNPGASEVCDEADVDEDCSGAADNADPAASGTIVYYVDADIDGFGNEASAYTACDATASSDVIVGGDCDDGNALANPSEAETCSTDWDDDCDGDDQDGYDTSLWHADADGDGYTNPSDTQTACEPPAGYSLASSAEDCDDANAAVNPAATESCNGIDDDCDAQTDELGSSGETTWYADVDGDGYGDASSSKSQCTEPSGYVTNSSDCDDGDVLFNPDASESCGDPDYNCDGVLPDATDADSDGVYACSDCDDSDALTGEATAWYADADSDSYGDSVVSTIDCAQPSGYVADATDCDDAEASAFPGGTEVCDEVDNDCDGNVDVGATDESVWYLDNDLDGYGDPSVTATACDEPSGYVLPWGDVDGDGDGDEDCDDAHVEVNPAEAESLYTIWDDDCSGAAFDGERVSVSIGGTMTTVTLDGENLIADEDATFESGAGSWQRVSRYLGLAIGDADIESTTWANTLVGDYVGIEYAGTGGAGDTTDECFVQVDLGSSVGDPLAAGEKVVIFVNVDNASASSLSMPVFIGDMTASGSSWTQATGTTWWDGTLGASSMSMPTSADAQLRAVVTSVPTATDLAACNNPSNSNEVRVTHVAVVRYW